MLNTFRKYSTSTGVKILYGVLALAFIIWGVGAVGMGQRMDVVAKVYGEPISQRDLDRATAALQRRYEELFKGNVQIPGLNLRGQALDQLLDELRCLDRAVPIAPQRALQHLGERAPLHQPPL